MDQVPQAISPGTLVQLNASTLQVLGAIGGMLVGGLIWVTRQLLSAKDEQIKEARRGEEYWQNMALGLMGSAHRAINIAERQLPPSTYSEQPRP